MFQVNLCQCYECKGTRYIQVPAQCYRCKGAGYCGQGCSLGCGGFIENCVCHGTNKKMCPVCHGKKIFIALVGCSKCNGLGAKVVVKEFHAPTEEICTQTVCA